MPLPRYRKRAVDQQPGSRAPAPAGEEHMLQARCEAVLRELRDWGVPLVWAHIPDVRMQRGVAGRQQARRAGLPDLIIGVPGWQNEGLVLGVELKTEAGRLRPEQAVWLAAWGERGAVCRSEGELLDLLRRWGVVR